MSDYEKALKQLDDYLWKPADYTMFPWCMSDYGSMVHWLETSGGDSHICWAYNNEEYNTSDDFIVFNVEEECGGYYQAIFSKRQKMSSDDFHERYGDNY